MQEIIDMHEELVKVSEADIDSLIESDDNFHDHACSPLGNPDEVEIAIQSWIQRLIQSGYYDDDANRAIFDGLADLVENLELTDTPDVDDPVHIKDSWIRNFNEKIHVKLLSMGIDFNEPGIAADGNAVPTENWISLDSEL